MKRGTLKGISEIVRETCRQEGIETPLNEYRLIQAWSKVLGSGVQSYTKEAAATNAGFHQKFIQSFHISSVLSLPHTE